MLSTILASHENVDFVACSILSIEYHRTDRMAPSRCLNVTAILSSFAEHKASLATFQASREFLVAFELRLSGSVPELPALGGPSECVRVPSLSTRCVVAYRKRLLRSVECECGRTPKEVLSGTFKKLRRTASTKKSMRMSRRFARTRSPLPSFGAGQQEWAWRPVGDIARDILRRAQGPSVNSSAR